MPEIKKDEKHYKILSKITAISSTIKKDDCSRHQLIYASQLYGTFFAVSAKLIFSERDKNILTGMHLNLINYKGLYNIGLLDKTKTSWGVHSEGKASLVLHLRVNDGTHGHGIKNQIIIDCDDTELNDISELRVIRKLYKVNKYSSLEHLSGRVFDSEFYYRDGSKIAELKRLDDAVIPDEHFDGNGKLTDDGNDWAIKTSRPGSCETFMSVFI